MIKLNILKYKTYCLFILNIKPIELLDNISNFNVNFNVGLKREL